MEIVVTESDACLTSEYKVIPFRIDNNSVIGGNVDYDI